MGNVASLIWFGSNMGLSFQKSNTWTIALTSTATSFSISTALENEWGATFSVGAKNQRRGTGASPFARDRLFGERCRWCEKSSGPPTFPGLRRSSPTLLAARRTRASTLTSASRRPKSDAPSRRSWNARRRWRHECDVQLGLSESGWAPDELRRQRSRWWSVWSLFASSSRAAAGPTTRHREDCRSWRTPKRQNRQKFSNLINLKSSSAD